MKTEAIAALAGKTDPSQEELDLANANLTEAGITGVSLMPDSVVDAAAQVTLERDELTTANAKLTTDLAAANTKLTSVTSENTVLKAKVAQMPAVVGAVTGAVDQRTEQTAEEADAEEMEGYAHNQYLKNLF
ncbi:MAG: hypothetical protein EOO61_19555 [Hymenobacter sp.]|nr:MAG: hypothetical protein EOO61_19555 [Hymenobacter sp.]